MDEEGGGGVDKMGKSESGREGPKTGERWEQRKGTTE